MRAHHVVLATLFTLGLAACDDPAPDGQSGQRPQQQEAPEPMQQPAPQPSTGG